MSALYVVIDFTKTQVLLGRDSLVCPPYALMSAIKLILSGGCTTELLSRVHRRIVEVMYYFLLSTTAWS